MAGTDATEDTGNPRDYLEERKKRDKVYTSSNRMARWIGVFAFENFIVGICTTTASDNFPWKNGLNLFAAIAAFICILTPVLAARANAKHPPGSTMKSFLKKGVKRQVNLCIVSSVIIMLGLAFAIYGYVECLKRGEYDPYLEHNKCTPHPENLKYLSVLDGVILVPMWILVMVFGNSFRKNKRFFTLAQPN